MANEQDRALDIAVDVTDPRLDVYTPVPPPSEGVCITCHGAPGPGYTQCYSCHKVKWQLSHIADQVVPISLYESGKQLWNTLRHYKDGKGITNVPELRREVSALLARFTHLHWDCLTGHRHQFNLITTVPSTRDREGPHPLVAAVHQVPWLRPEYDDALIRGPGIMRHNVGTDDGYQVTTDVRGVRVLLIDDTYTTGARLHSAASALRLAGASHVTGLVVGRVINPDFSETTSALWAEARSRTYRFNKCCLCATTWPRS